MSKERRLRLLAKNRKCEKCGASLSDEDVMKIKVADGSWEVVPFTLCPKCFTDHMRALAEARRRGLKEP